MEQTYQHQTWRESPVPALCVRMNWINLKHPYRVTDICSSRHSENVNFSIDPLIRWTYTVIIQHVMSFTNLERRDELNNKYVRYFMSTYENQTGSLAPQSILHQRYLIVGQAGRGGMSAVFQAIDTKSGNRHVAIEKMSQGSSQT